MSALYIIIERECVCDEPDLAVYRSDAPRMIPAKAWLRCLKCKGLRRPYHV